MTSPANDTSELTAYSLGELRAHQAGEIHQLLASCPAATSELEQIEAITEALRQRAPIPQDRLHPEQRHAVLHPGPLPRRVVPQMPRQVVKKPALLWPVMRGILKAAALITLTGAAYWAGRRETPLSQQSAPEVVTTVPQTQSVKPLPEIRKPAAAKPVAPVPVIVSAPILEPAPVASLPEKPAVLVVTASAVPKTKEPEAIIVSPAPSPLAPAPVAVTHLNKEVVFISTSRQAADRFSLRPSDIRPKPVQSSSKDQYASPLLSPPSAQSVVAGKAAAAEVYIHSWKAEITTCPWNKGTRLLRVTVQLPADQPAATTPASYPLEISFDSRTVREFRRLSEQHLPAAELRSAGTQVVWYEFQPVNADVPPSGKAIATITLEKGRFTAQSVGPFDGSKLNVQDRGTKWQAAREDYIFESAVVGFGILLRGDHQSPDLNHQLVLALAEKGRGNDIDGERTRFIRQLNDARRAAGL